MKRVYTLIFFLIILISSLTNQFAALALDKADNNQHSNVIKLIDKTYQDAHIKKFNAVLQKAKAYADKNYVENGVIVLDVDETILDNRAYYTTYKVFTLENWNKWIEQEEALPIKETVDFINWAKNRGYKIFLITGRYEALRQATIRNLAKYNIYYDKLFCRPDEYNYKSLKHYKLSLRKKLSEEGYKIIVNIGDQKVDLKGNYGKGFRLPNPIYRIP